MLHKKKRKQINVYGRGIFVDEHNNRFSALLCKNVYNISLHSIAYPHDCELFHGSIPTHSLLGRRCRPRRQAHMQVIFWGSRVVCRLINRNVSCRKWASEATELSLNPPCICLTPQCIIPPSRASWQSSSENLTLSYSSKQASLEKTCATAAIWFNLSCIWLTNHQQQQHLFWWFLPPSSNAYRYSLLCPFLISLLLLFFGPSSSFLLAFFYANIAATSMLLLEANKQ